MNQYKLGLVLSGGGVKGAGHIGLIKALEEHEIEPDLVSGCSAGSIVGLLYASGLKSDEILYFFKNNPIFNPRFLAVRKPGLLDITKFRSHFEKTLKQKTFEELQKKLFVASTNMEYGNVQYHHSGNIIPAVLASCAFPGILSPIEIDGLYHMDGGIIDNFPIKPLMSYDVPIIGSFACYTGPKGKQDLSNSAKIFLRSTQLLLYTSVKGNFKHAAHMFMPKQLSNIGFFDMKKAQKAFDLGYDNAMKNIEELKYKLSEENINSNVNFS